MVNITCFLCFPATGYANSVSVAKQVLENDFTVTVNAFEGSRSFTLPSNDASSVALRIVEEGNDYSLEWRFETNAAMTIRGSGADIEGLSFTINGQTTVFWRPNGSDIIREAEILLNAAIGQSYMTEPIVNWRSPNRQQMNLLKNLSTGVRASYNLGYTISGQQKSATYEVPLSTLDQIHKTLATYSILCRCRFTVPPASDRMLAAAEQREVEIAEAEAAEAERAREAEAAEAERQQEIELERIRAQERAEEAAAQRAYQLERERIEAEREAERRREVLQRQREMDEEARKRRQQTERDRERRRSEDDDDW